MATSSANPPQRGRVRIRYKNGLLRHDEIIGPIFVDVEMRTIAYMKVDRIYTTFNFDAITSYEYAEIIQDSRPDVRLLPPQVVEPQERDPALDWPVDPRY